MSPRAAAADRYLKESLMEGEEILWEGRSAPFRLMEGDDGRKVALGMSGTVLSFGLLIAWYIAETPGYQWSVVAFLTAIMLGLLAAPVIAWQRLLRQRYWITDRRILTIRGGWVEGSMALADLDQIALQPLRTGVETVVLGSQVIAEGTRQLRWRSIHPLAAAPEQHIGVVLYGLEDARAVVDTLSSLTGVKAA